MIYSPTFVPDPGAFVILGERALDFLSRESGSCFFRKEEITTKLKASRKDSAKFASLNFAEEKGNPTKTKKSSELLQRIFHLSLS